MESLAALPKAELHIHLGGAVPLEYLKEIAEPNDVKQLEQAVANLKKGETSYVDCFAIFPFISKLVNSVARIEEATFRLAEEQVKQGVTVLELRSGLKALQGKTEEGYLQAMLRGLARSSLKHWGVLISVQRASSVEFVEKSVGLAIKYREEGVVGIDIGGNSLEGDVTALLPTLKRARFEENLFFAIHIGESAEEKDQMLLLEELQPHRVGHAVTLTPAARQFVLDHKIPVEVCLTSAQLVMHDGVHPWVRDFTTVEEMHPIVICTDDPTCFGCSLLSEYEYLLKHGITLEQVEALARRSSDYSFIQLRKNMVYIATSLDGYIADPNGAIEWLNMVPNPEKLDFGYAKMMKGIDALVMGRNTFQTVADMDVEWPYTKHVFVLSNSMQKVPEKLKNQVTLIKGQAPLKESVLAKIHALGYEKLYIDGGLTIQSFMRENLIDEFVITKIPIILGGGIPLFGGTPRLALRHVKTEVFLGQIVMSKYVKK
jgi:dihydrofolate reductase/adenosine deaminase